MNVKVQIWIMTNAHCTRFLLFLSSDKFTGWDFHIKAKWKMHRKRPAISWQMNGICVIYDTKKCITHIKSHQSSGLKKIGWNSWNSRTPKLLEAVSTFNRVSEQNKNNPEHPTWFFYLIEMYAHCIGSSEVVQSVWNDILMYHPTIICCHKP